MTKQQKVRRLVESALMVALSVVLSALPVFKLPFGGSVTLFSQVPIILIGFRYGMLWGMETGLVGFCRGENRKLFFLRRHYPHQVYRVRKGMFSISACVRKHPCFLFYTTIIHLFL